MTIERPIDTLLVKGHRQFGNSIFTISTIGPFIDQPFESPPEAKLDKGSLMCA